MSSKLEDRLEDRLNEIEKKSPISSDRDLTSALMQIIEEEQKKIRKETVSYIGLRDKVQ